MFSITHHFDFDHGKWNGGGLAESPWNPGCFYRMRNPESRAWIPGSAGGEQWMFTITYDVTEEKYERENKDEVAIRLESSFSLRPDSAYYMQFFVHDGLNSKIYAKREKAKKEGNSAHWISIYDTSWESLRQFLLRNEHFDSAVFGATTVYAF